MLTCFGIQKKRGRDGADGSSSAASGSKKAKHASAASASASAAAQLALEVAAAPVEKPAISEMDLRQAFAMQPRMNSKQLIDSFQLKVGASKVRPTEWSVECTLWCGCRRISSSLSHPTVSDLAFLAFFQSAQELKEQLMALVKRLCEPVGADANGMRLFALKGESL